MKKRFGKLLLAIVMTLQLVPSSMTTIAANDSVAYKDDFVQVTMENKPTAAYETGSSEIPDGVSKLNVEVHVDGALKASRTLTFGSATNPEKTEITANAGYAVEQVTLNGEAFDNSIVYNREVGESEKNLVIDVYTKADVLNQNHELEENKLAANDVRTKSTTTYTKKAEFFVLLPSSELPKNLAGNYNPKNFVPSNSNPWIGPNWVGVDINHNQGTGFSGFISDEAYKIAYVNGKPITNENGVDSKYIYVPKGHIPLKYIVQSGVDIGKEIDLTNIVWYSIKKQDNQKPHVDGYIKDVKVEIGYFANIDGYDTPVIDKVVTGDEYQVKDYNSIEGFPERKGYVFIGWNTEADGFGINYAPNAKFTVKSSVALYAQWKKTDQKYTVQHIDEDSNEILKSDEGIDAKFNDRIIGEKCKTSIDNYTFTKADNLTVGTDNDKNIVKVYYSKDRNKDGVPDKYQIEVTYTAENGTIDSAHANGKKIYVTLLNDGKWATKEDGGIGYLSDDQIATATAAKGYSQSSLSWSPETPKTSLELNTDTEFIAKFEEDAEVKISYKSSNDSMGIVTNANEKVKPLTGIVKGSKAVAKKGYAFQNWTNAKGTIVSWDEEFKPAKVDGLNVAGKYTANFGIDENGDKIPDDYQIKVIYKAVNGTIDSEHANDIDNKTFYVTLFKDGKWATKEDGGIGYLSDDQIATATAARGYSQDSLKWTPKVPTTKLDLNEDTQFVADFEKDSYRYSIEYYYDGVKGKTDTKTAKFEEVIKLKPEVSVMYEGRPYALDKVENNSLSIDTEESKNVIRLYYGTDENKDKIPDDYQIKVIYKAVNGTIDSEHANDIDNKTFYVTLLKDGKWATKEDGGIGHLSDDQIATATAARGYSQDSLKWTPKVPTTKLDLNEDTQFVADFEKDSYHYSIEYYYDGVKGKTDSYTAMFEEEITWKPEVSVMYEGRAYALDKVENNPLSIGTEESKNVIRLYYGTDENKDQIPDKYQIKVIYKAVNGTIDSEHANIIGNKTFYVTLLKDGKWATKEDGGIGYLSDNQIATATAAKGYSQSSLSWSPETPTTKLPLNTETEFVAKFEEDAKVTISYKSNDENMGTVTNAKDEVKPLTGTVKGSKAVAKEGYAFKNWTNAEGTIVSWDEEFKPAKVDGLNVAGEYTANFGTDENGDKIPDEYQVKYTYQAATDQKGTVSGTTVEWINKYKVENGKLVIKNNKPVAIDAHPTQPSTVKADKGYHFQKWNDGTNDFATDEALRNAKYEEDTTFSAYFEEDAMVTISYKSNDENMGTVTNAKDEVKPVTGTVKGSKAEAKKGYAFKYWTDAKDTIVSWDEEFKPAKVDGLNVAGEYTANFGTDENGDKIPDEYQVKYTYQAAADQKGTVSGTTVEWINKYKVENGKLVIENNKPVAIDAHPTQPSTVKADKGYHFQKWNDGTNDFATDEALRNAKYEEDTTFSAYFEEDAEVTISYKSNDETMGTVTNAKDEVKPVTGTVKGSKAEASEGYAFKNWTNAEGTIVSWDEEFKPAKVDGLNVAGEYTANFGTDENGDKIPDEYQAVVTFAAVNGTVSFDKTYVTLYDAQGNYAEDGTGKLAQNQIAAATPNSGYHFVNWTPETPKQDMEITNKGAAFTANHAINTYAAAVRFLNEDTGEELAPAVTVNNIEHGTYLYGEAHRISIPGYVFTVADTKIVESDHVIVNVYYSADTKGGTPDPDTTPDGTPDKYQVRFEYVADTNGSVTGTTVEYVTRPGNNTTAAVRPQALVDAIANDGYSFMSWTANGNVYVNTDAMRNTYFTEDTVFTAGFAEVVSPILPTPVTPTPPAVTPPTPGTPVPAAPAAPVTPVAPVIPPVIVPVIPTPTPTPTPNPGPIVNEDDPDQPQGGESTEVQENPTPKGGGSQNEWALINLICAGGTVLLGLFLLLSKLKKEEEEEDEKTSAMRNDDEQSKRYKRRKWLRVASTITAVVSVIAFFLTEDITLPMVLIDKWTLLMAAFLIVQVIFVLFGRKWKELDENETNTETAHS
ncbi:InlB B-repeat-containing protein [[Clostridium] innocuum]|nr:InlB B-repeat-containing protein [[Clostridium] innocuum]MCR0576823.1 InlB B-repeat-containing protein [[Clostridium] innocuum]